MAIKMEIVEMTPMMAAAILASNGHNRTLSANRMQQLAGAMLRGEFLGLNGETIKLTEDGMLVDGQHRLAAIIQSDTTQTVIVVRGVPGTAQETIDIGRARTFSDMLVLRGQRHAAAIAAATRMILAYERTGIPWMKGARVQPTPQQLLACLDRHPGMRDSLAAGGHTHSILVLSRSMVVALHYLFASADRDDADQFFTSLTLGDGLRSGDPIFALRDRFVRALTSTDKMREIVALAFTIRAWNAFRRGDQVAKLQWKPGGGSPERFPPIEGCQIPRADDGQ